MFPTKIVGIIAGFVKSQDGKMIIFIAEKLLILGFFITLIIAFIIGCYSNYLQ